MSIVYYEGDPNHYRWFRGTPRFQRHNFAIAVKAESRPLEEASAYLFEVTQRPEFAHDVHLRIQVAKVAAQIPNSATNELIRKLAQDKNRKVRRAAAYSLIDFQVPSAVSDFRLLLGDPVADVRVATAISLGLFLRNFARSNMHGEKTREIARAVASDALSLFTEMREGEQYYDRSSRNNVLEAIARSIHFNYCGSFGSPTDIKQLDEELWRRGRDECDETVMEWRGNPIDHEDYEDTCGTFFKGPRY